MVCATPVRAQTAPVFTAVIAFDVADHQIKSNARVTLDGVASRLLGNNHGVRITGYADGLLRTAAEDRRLSLRRAVAVRDYLMEKGVSAERINAYARGEAANNNIGARISVFAAP